MNYYYDYVLWLNHFFKEIFCLQLSFVLTGILTPAPAPNRAPESNWP